MIAQGNELMKSPLLSIVSLAAALSATAAHAQGVPPRGAGGPPAPRDTVTVGVGVGLTTSYDGAGDYKAIPGGALLGTISGHDFQLNGPQLFVDAIPNDPRRKIDVELGPVVSLRFNRTGGVSDSRVAALGERDIAVELGARGAIGVRGLVDRTDKLAFAVTGVWDVAGAHRSAVITPSIEYSRPLGRRTFARLAVNAEFVGKRYADYYFGINPAGAAASGLARHDPDGGVASLGGNVLALHSLSGKRAGWALFGIASYKRLQGDISGSPIVRDTGSPDQLFASVGLAYTF